MDRYVIVCLLNGEALNFHEKLVTDVCSKFNVKRQKLPGHFTIKAPFETDRISEVECVIEDFVANNKKEPMKMQGINHFRTDTIFMDINMSDEGLKVHDAFIDSLKTLPWLEWKRHDGKGKTFHATIVTRIPREKYDSIWNYTNSFNPEFNIYFDNITILKWENYKWETYKEHQLK
ncbi:2'-5' RNA ligase [Clostridium pascui]|uniref:2'-5' RNA ligase family protein n=1 Tax=Clostridium pascui TaxID=46609 RepID=UPI00195EF36D|nr:2'-5' RNA ligase family protein [Clostridium pascui]MBM7870981.1 2'-5' RNA ligase [Clostridium pascui]